MSYNIVIDSCGELFPEMKEDKRFKTASLEIDVDDHHIIDDETFNQLELLRLISESPNVPKSSCPSPEKYLEGFDKDAEHNYAVTLSSNLSGSYNSAELGKQLFLEEYPGKEVYVFDSRSASVGETLIGLKVKELEAENLSFQEIVDKTESYIKEMKTYFVLETLETLRKNGRLSNLKAFIANTLNIKPVMGADDEGKIEQLDQARGMKKALDKMVDHIIENTENPEEKVLAIAHCNCMLRAIELKKHILGQAGFKDVVIVDTAGISTMYANDGGIIVVV